VAQRLSEDGVKARPYHAGLAAQGTLLASGNFFLRDDHSRRLRDHRVRHGHQQAKRAFRGPLRSAEEY